MENSIKKISKIRKNMMILIAISLMISVSIIPLVTADPKPKSFARGRGNFVFDYYHYNGQSDMWETDFPLVCNLNFKVTAGFHPHFGYGNLQLICHEEGSSTEANRKIITCTNIFEPKFINTAPIRFISEFEGTADLIWGNSNTEADISVVVWDGTPFGTMDRCKIEIGDGEPIVLGEKQIISLGGQNIEITGSYDTRVERGNYTTIDGLEIPDVIIIGGAEQYRIGAGDFVTLLNNEPLIIDGSDLSIDSVQVGTNVLNLDGKGNDIVISGGEYLRIGGIEPIYLHLGDTIVADGGYTVLTGLNDLTYDPMHTDTIFIKI